MYFVACTVLLSVDYSIYYVCCSLYTTLIHHLCGFITCSNASFVPQGKEVMHISRSGFGGLVYCQVSVLFAKHSSYSSVLLCIPCISRMLCGIFPFSSKPQVSLEFFFGNMILSQCFGQNGIKSNM